MKRKLEQLNLLDDFLFDSVLSYPEIGEEFCRKILKILLNVDMGRLRIVPQKISTCTVAIRNHIFMQFIAMKM